jgi:hypothetical protein
LFFFVLCSLCCQFLCINWQHRIHKTKKNNPQKLAT